MKISYSQIVKFFTLILIIAIITAFQVSDICSSGQYFDVSKLECNVCPKSMIPAEGGKILIYFFKEMVVLAQ
jgi:hypothetical protein